MKVDVELVNTIIKGSYVSVLVLYGVLGYRLLDKWALPLIMALKDCAKAFGSLTHAVDSSRTQGSASTAPPPSQKDRKT